MSRKPRPPKESIFAHDMWQHMMWVGLLMGGVCLFAQAFAIYSGWENWQTIVFTVLALLGRLWPRRRRGRRRLALENGRPGLLQRLRDRQRQLRDLGPPAQARELRRQLQILGDEPLVLALEEPTDLAERLDLAFVSERHHGVGSRSSTRIRGKRKPA